MTLERYFLILISLFFAGCGKYLPPIPPEQLAPAAVQELLVRPEIGAVVFEWRSPEKDVRGEDLRTLNGYSIARKEITRESDILDDDVEFEVVGELKDTSVEELKRLQAEAREQKRPVRRVKVDETLKQFSFRDTSVQPGKTYVYKIVPINQGDEEGAVTQYIRIAYRGDMSDVRLIPIEDLGALESTALF